MRDGSATEYVVALTTLPDVAEARRFVRRLVEAEIVACGTVVPGATSIYRWEGRVTEEAETLVFLKTRGARWPDLARAVQAAHPYDVPELLALPVTQGLAPYLAWVDGATSRKEEPT